MRDAAITLAQAASWCGGTVAAEFEAVTFRGANFDTRTLQTGELFVAVIGARNGHAFAASAMARGAAAVLASEHLPSSIPTIYVKDTVKALQDIARGYRRTLSCRCVGITGSVGKTTTKEMISAVLSCAMRTQKTEANFNNDIGLPVTVLSLARDCEAAVLEMGMNHFGEISLLTGIAQPDIAVITNVGTMHIENLGSREGILRAKLEIMEGLRENGRVVFCGDNDLLHGVAEEYHAVEFGLEAHNAVRAVNIRTVGQTTAFTVIAFGETFEVSLPTVGEHNVRNALCAVTVGLLCGVKTEAICRGLAAFRNTGLRQSIYTVDGVKIIADCYNAGPESMRAALKVLSSENGRKIAVLGAMLELGDLAPQAHYEVGLESGGIADLLFAYGANSEEYVRGASESGIAFAKKFDTHAALAEALKKELRPGDTLLVKGSHGMHMENILQLLDMRNKGDN